MGFLRKVEKRQTVLSMHELIMYFAQASTYESALKELKSHQEKDKEENGYNGYWQDIVIKDVKQTYPLTAGCPNSRDAYKYMYKNACAVDQWSEIFVFEMTDDDTYLFLTSDEYRGIMSEKAPRKEGLRQAVVIKAKTDNAAKEAFKKKFPDIAAPKSPSFKFMSYQQDSKEAFATLKDAKTYVMESQYQGGHHLQTGTCYAFEVKSPKGWLFAADIHH